jgi:hypothetical protein
MIEAYNTHKDKCDYFDFNAVWLTDQVNNPIKLILKNGHLNILKLFTLNGFKTEILLQEKWIESITKNTNILKFLFIDCNLPIPPLPKIHRQGLAITLLSRDFGTMMISYGIKSNDAEILDFIIQLYFSPKIIPKGDIEPIEPIEQIQNLTFSRNISSGFAEFAEFDQSELFAPQHPKFGISSSLWDRYLPTMASSAINLGKLDSLMLLVQKYNAVINPLHKTVLLNHMTIFQKTTLATLANNKAMLSSSMSHSQSPSNRRNLNQNQNVPQNVHQNIIRPPNPPNNIINGNIINGVIQNNTIQPNNDEDRKKKMFILNSVQSIQWVLTDILGHNTASDKLQLFHPKETLWNIINFELSNQLSELLVSKYITSLYIETNTIYGFQKNSKNGKNNELVTILIHHLTKIPYFDPNGLSWYIDLITHCSKCNPNPVRLFYPITPQNTTIISPKSQKIREKYKISQKNYKMVLKPPGKSNLIAKLSSSSSSPRHNDELHQSQHLIDVLKRHPSGMQYLYSIHYIKPTISPSLISLRIDTPHTAQFIEWLLQTDPVQFYHAYHQSKPVLWLLLHNLAPPSVFKSYLSNPTLIASGLIRLMSIYPSKTVLIRCVRRDGVWPNELDVYYTQIMELCIQFCIDHIDSLDRFILGPLGG